MSQINKTTRNTSIKSKSSQDLFLQQKEKNTLTFNIRGTRYETSVSTLREIPDSFLRHINESSQYYDPVKKEFYFDRDPHVFNNILNLAVHGKLHVPRDVCGEVFRHELEFWGVPRVAVGECCWRVFYQLDEDKEVLEKLRLAHDYDSTYSPESYNSLSFRYKIWLVFDQPESSLAAKVWHIFYLSVVLLSAIVLCLWTLEDYRTEHYLSPFDKHEAPSIRDSENSKMTKFMLSDPLPSLFALDIFCMFIFSFEFILHFIVSPRKLKFCKVPLNINGFFVVLSMWGGFALEFLKGSMAKNLEMRVLYFLCKALTMTRLLLFLRMERHFSALRVLILSVKSSAKELTLLLLAFMVAVLIFASLIYFAEIFENGRFESIFIAMWWSVVTMTTVGYGDYYPTSTLGYIVGIFCAMSGVVIMAMPIAIVASNFAEYYQRNKDRDRVVNQRKLTTLKLVKRNNNKIQPIKNGISDQLKVDELDSY